MSVFLRGVGDREWGKGRLKDGRGVIEPRGGKFVWAELCAISDFIAEGMNIRHVIFDNKY